jgi:hypothetical protein
MPSEISDHDAAVAFLKCPKSTSCSFTREIWQYENILILPNFSDLELFNNKMNEINWNEKIKRGHQVNQLVIIYIKKIRIQVARNHDIFVYLMS